MNSDEQQAFSYTNQHFADQRIVYKRLAASSSIG